MWHIGSAQAQGGVGETAVGSGFAFGSPMSQGRDEGARPKVSSPTTDCKSYYDSHNDSGFLSGSNLVSSSSLSCEETSSMRCKESTSPQEGHRSPDPKTQGIPSVGHLDSGIDISDQLSSLHLASSTTSSSSTTSDTPENDTISPKKVSAPPRRSCLELNEAQLALLQEIFQRDEDGDT